MKPNMIMLTGFLSVVCFAQMGAAQSQQYPSETISLYVGLPPGGGADVLARYYAKELQAMAGHPVVVLNKVGAGGNHATQQVARSPADGHHILFAHNNQLAGNFYLYKSVPFTVDDFIPVAPAVKSAFALVVDGKSPIKSVAELTAAIKKKSGNAFYAESNPMATASAEVYLNDAGVTATRVSYKAAAQILNDLSAGHVDFFFHDAMAAVGPASRGDIRILAVTTDKRMSMMPDMPTMQESGFSDFEQAAWFAVFVPAKTSGPVVEKIRGWINKINETPGTVEFLRPIGAEPYLGGADVLVNALQKRTNEYRRLYEKGKIARVE